MTLIPLIEQKHSQDHFSGWKRNCKFVKPMFLPVEIKLQNNDGVLIFLMFGKFSWSQKQNVYTLGIYKESVSANSCSHVTLLNKFLCDKLRRGKKGKKNVKRIQNIFISHLTNLTVLSRLAIYSPFETSMNMFCPTFLAHPVEREKNDRYFEKANKIQLWYLTCFGKGKEIKKIFLLNLIFFWQRRK